MVKCLMKMNNYWVNRFIEEENRLNKLSLKQVDVAKKEYMRAYKNVSDSIYKWYGKYAKNNKISFLEAKQKLNGKELKEHRMSLEEYISKGESLNLNRDSKVLKELELASTRVHLDRLESLRQEIKAEMNLLTVKTENSLKKHLSKVIDDTYYRTAYHLKDVADIEKLNADLVERIIYKPWTSDNKNWSKRLWGHDKRINNILHQGLVQNIVSGRSLDKIIQSVSDRFNTEINIATRLIMTESAAYHSKAKEKCFKDLGVEKYEIVATLDNRTSSTCRSMDNKVFGMKDYKVGLTAPPFHVMCRTTTAPYYEEIEGDVNKRATRNLKGDYELVDDMSYEKWRKNLVKAYGKGTVDIHELKIKNEVQDFKKYQNFKEVIPEKFSPKSFEKFQEIKYNNSVEYSDLKLRYKILTEYNLKVHEGRQGKHILGHDNYAGKSYLLDNVNLQELARKYAGTGELKRDKKGIWTKKEFINTNQYIGIMVSENKREKTKRFSIHYSNTGIHIVPRGDKNGKR